MPFQSKVSTMETVSPFLTEPKEIIEYYNPSKKHGFVDLISKFIADANLQVRIFEDVVFEQEIHKSNSPKFSPEPSSRKLAGFLSDVGEHLTEMGLYGGSKSVLLHLIQVESMRRSCQKKNFVGLLNILTTQLMKIQKLISDEIHGDMYEHFLDEYASPKVSQLLQILRKFYHKSKTEFSCIVFVQSHFTAKVLYHILKELSLRNDDLKFLKPNCTVEQNSDPQKNAREQLCLLKWNQEVLSKFKNGLINCIIATDDEGLDLPLCTLVVRFNTPMDLESYIQSRGKTRHSTSHFVKLVPHGDDQCLRRYDEFREKALQEAFDGVRSVQQAPINQDKKPHIVMHKNNPKIFITEQNALSIVNSYCSSLSSTAAPIWIQEDVESSEGTQFRVYLTLPLMSPLKSSLKSDQCQSIDAARRSAAFKACLQLQKIGELDENLLPRRNYAELPFPHLQCKDAASTTDSKTRYDVVYPKAWFGAYPKDNATLYLHVIEMIPKNVGSNGSSEFSSFYNVLSSKNTFGILSSKKMPAIPEFPIFARAGDFQVNLKVNNSLRPLTKIDINLLKEFHYLIFDEILGISKGFTIFDVDNRENCFLVVPVGGDGQIDWNVVKANNKISTVRPSKPLKMNKPDYEHALVLPTYRVSCVYLVTEVCSQTPKSPFITKAYPSYVEYYKQKHNLAIESPNEPMLRVRPVPTEMNWLKSSKKTATSNYEELLVPELCKRITFPTSYWLKAAAVPSILHRASQLLVAEDLRLLIASEAGLSLKPADRWDPLIVKSTDSTVNGVRSKSLYSWTEEEEPMDLDRRADTLTSKDVDYYWEFMSRVNSEDEENLKSSRQYAREREPVLRMLAKTDARGPSPVDILQSLSAKTSNDVLDYERLETLGDAFLKYAISLYLYQTYPRYRESSLTDLKCKVVSNANLYCCGKEKNLAGYMSVEEFLPTDNFKVPAFGVDPILKQLLIDTEISASVLHDMKIPQKERFSGLITQNSLNVLEERLSERINDTIESTGAEGFLGLQVVFEKSIADCVEAVTGVYLEHLGVEAALKVIKWFGILPESTSVEEYLYADVQDPRKRSGSVDRYMPWASIIEERIGYTFSDRALLLQAFTHNSFVSNQITDSYEKLEFLGDSILDFLLTVYIYETFVNLDPGELTDLRSALVNNCTFACISVRYGLHMALLANSPDLLCVIDKFVRFQEDRDYKIDDELLRVLSEGDDCYMAEHVDVPKVLGDLFESVIAAVYLDSKKDLHVTWKVIYNLMKKEIETFSKDVPKQSIRVIYETIGANPKFSEAQVVEGTTVVMVTLTINHGKNKKFFHGFGTTTKLAKCAASKQAVKYLGSKKL